MGVSSNIYESFMYQYDVEQAYTLAYALGAIHCLGQQSHALAVPPPARFLVVLTTVGDGFHGNECGKGDSGIINICFLTMYIQPTLLGDGSLPNSRCLNQENKGITP